MQALFRKHDKLNPVPFILVIITLLGSFFLYKHFKTRDFYIINGYVTGKKSAHVMCSHTYLCNCHQQCSGSGKDQVCYTICDTCREHLYDVDWVVNSTIGNFIIDREDKQGLVKPKRWVNVNEADPVSDTRYFKNPIKGNKLSLFNNKKKTSTPYPGKIYDYYKVDRFVNSTETFKVKEDYNKLLTELNTKLSKLYKVNIILVLSEGKDFSFYEDLEANWLNGKLTDIIIGVDINPAHSINFVRIISFNEEELKERLRVEIQELKTFEFSKLEEILIKTLAKGYAIPDMSKWNYLLK